MRSTFPSWWLFGKSKTRRLMVFEQLVEGVPTACTTIEEVSSVSFFELPLVCFFLAASCRDCVESDQGLALFSGGASSGIVLLASTAQFGASDGTSRWG